MSDSSTPDALMLRPVPLTSVRERDGRPYTRFADVEEEIAKVLHSDRSGAMLLRRPRDGKPRRSSTSPNSARGGRRSLASNRKCGPDGLTGRTPSILIARVLRGTRVASETGVSPSVSSMIATGSSELVPEFRDRSSSASYAATGAARSCSTNRNAAGRFSSQVARIWSGGRMNPPSSKVRGLSSTVNDGMP